MFFLYRCSAIIFQICSGYFNDPVFYYPANNGLLGTYNFYVLTENNEMARIKFLLLSKISRFNRENQTTTKVEYKMDKKRCYKKGKMFCMLVSLLR